MVWVDMRAGRSIFFPLSLTFGIVIFGFLLALGILLNWQWVWELVEFVTDKGIKDLV